MAKAKPALLAVAGALYAGSLAIVLMAMSCQPATLADLPSRPSIRSDSEDRCPRGADHLVLPPLAAKGRLPVLDVDDEDGLASQAPPVAPRSRLGTPADDGSLVPAPYTRLMRVTAYCACKQCCGQRAAGITASGLKVSANGGHFVSADPGVPMGTMLVIPGYASERPVPVLDRGGAIRGNRLDIFIPSHKAAQRWGVKWLEVTFIPAGSADDTAPELAKLIGHALSPRGS